MNSEHFKAVELLVAVAGGSEEDIFAAAEQIGFPDTAACLFTWAGALSNWSVPAAGLAVLVTLGAVARMLCEERLVVERYPEYRDYARKTRRMVPYVF